METVQIYVSGGVNFATFAGQLKIITRIDDPSLKEENLEHHVWDFTSVSATNKDKWEDFYNFLFVIIQKQRVSGPWRRRVCINAASDVAITTFRDSVELLSDSYCRKPEDHVSLMNLLATAMWVAL